MLKKRRYRHTAAIPLNTGRQTDKHRTCTKSTIISISKIRQTHSRDASARFTHGPGKPPRIRGFTRTASSFQKKRKEMKKKKLAFRTCGWWQLRTPPAQAPGSQVRPVRSGRHSRTHAARSPRPPPIVLATADAPGSVCPRLGLASAHKALALGLFLRP